MQMPPLPPQGRRGRGRGREEVQGVLDGEGPSEGCEIMVGPQGGLQGALVHPHEAGSAVLLLEPLFLNSWSHSAPMKLA